MKAKGGHQSASNLDKASGRTRTKSNAATANVLSMASANDKKLSKQGVTKGSASGAHFLNPQQTAAQMQSQTFHVTDSSQYYSNGLQGPHTKTQQAQSKAMGTSSSRNREGSSLSIGNRKNSQSNQKTSLSNLIKQSQGGKQIKNSITSRNQAGIGGHVNSQASKVGHRSVASSGAQYSTLNNISSSKPQLTKAQLGANQNHKIIDEVVLRLSQQQAAAGA